MPEEEKDEQTPLTRLTASLMTKKAEAIQAKQESAIDDIWDLAIERYDGIDDANRSGKGRRQVFKGSGINDSLQHTGGRSGNQMAPKKSSVFIKATSRYVDGGASKVADKTIGERSFRLRPTPVPHDLETSDAQVRLSSGALATRPADQASGPSTDQAPSQVNGNSNLPSGQPQQATVPTENRVPLTVADLMKEARKKAENGAKMAEDYIWDWLVEAKYPAIKRRAIKAMAKIGTAVLVGPVPKTRRWTKFSQAKGIEKGESTVPDVELVDVRDVFPDPGCGERMWEASWMWQRGYYSQSKVTSLKYERKMKFHPDMIDKVLNAGPTGVSNVTQESEKPREGAAIDPHKNDYEWWKFTGAIRRDEFDSLQLMDEETEETDDEKVADEEADPHAMVWAEVMMIGDIPVRTALSPMTHMRTIPYYNWVWKVRDGSPYGVGIGEDAEAGQSIINSGTRRTLEDGAISIGGNLVVADSVYPEDGSWHVAGGGVKVWRLNPDAIIDDTQKAFQFHQIPNHTTQLLSIVENGYRVLEETAFPLNSQGPSGRKTEEAIKKLQHEESNADQLLRDLARGIDAAEEPMIEGFYNWLLVVDDGSVPDEAKVDVRVQVDGAFVLVEQAIQEEFLLSLLPFAEKPIYGINPKKLMCTALQSKRITLDSVKYTKEEQDKIDSTPPPQHPQVTVQEMKEQGKEADRQLAREQDATDSQIAMDIAVMNTGIQIRKQERLEGMDADKRASAQQDIDTEVARLQNKIDVKEAEFARRHEISAEESKTRLAEVVMRLLQQEKESVRDALAGVQ